MIFLYIFFSKKVFGGSNPVAGWGPSPPMEWNNRYTNNINSKKYFKYTITNKT